MGAVAWGLLAITPFPIPAHRTGRTDFRYPALRLASLRGPQRGRSGQVGIRIVTFEACSGFTRVTARRIAQPPKVTFVTRLQPCQLPSRAARQLPDLSTIIRVEPSSTFRRAVPTTPADQT
jgi:hypothetical protein